MKKTIRLCFLIVALLLSGCGNVEYHNKKADDDISKAIYETVGEDVYYCGKMGTSQAELSYKYLIWKEREDLLPDVVSVVNATIEKEKIGDAVNIFLCYEKPGGMARAVRLCNYYKD